MKKITLIIAATSLLMSASSLAHRAWIKPDATVHSQSNSWVAFDAAISNDIFGFDHNAMRLNSVLALGPDGKEIELQNTFSGKYRSVFDLHLTKEGTYKIFSASQTLQARWVDEKGENKFWPGRGVVATAETFEREVPKDAKNLTITQHSRRIETFVTAGAPTKTVLNRTNKGFELQAETHPNDLYHGETAQFKLFIDGKPAAGASIEIIPAGMRYRQQQNEMIITADANGNFSVTWPIAGQYFMEASYSDNNATAPAQVRRGSYSAVFEVL